MYQAPGKIKMTATHELGNWGEFNEGYIYKVVDEV